MRGSSVWLYESLHLSELSQRAESLRGELVTNQDFDDAVIFARLAAMLFGIPIQRNLTPDRSFYEIPLLALCAMILNPFAYFNPKLVNCTALVRQIRTIPGYLHALQGGLVLAKGLSPHLPDPPKFPTLIPNPNEKYEAFSAAIQKFERSCERASASLRLDLDTRDISSRGDVVNLNHLDKVMEQVLLSNLTV
ncbi:hypothetical protein MPER_06114 [Moniliophthora perniciosa FA553]|nr:hypothetical protein MPER_06114 [Moniliophthora perniciosa FA553]